MRKFCGQSGGVFTEFLNFNTCIIEEKAVNCARSCLRGKKVQPGVQELCSETTRLIYRRIEYA